MPSVQERIFRSSALARHTSPEGLDTLLEITTVKGWIGLITLTAVVVAALVWGVLGRIPQVVAGQGIMVSGAGVYRIQSSAAGQIDSVLVDPGSMVHKGQTIAVLAQPELRITIQQQENALAELRANRASTASLLASNRDIERTSIDQQQKQADEAILAADKRLEYLDARIASEQSALTKGLLTPDALQSTIAQRAETQLSKLSTVARKQELSASAVRLQVTSNQNLFTLDQQILQAQNRLDQQKAQLTAAASVTSPYDGIVVERLTDPGQSIGAGAAIVTVEPTGVPLQVLMFIPLEGKRIRPGMRAEMVPGGVKPEETGYFIGTVQSVSTAPLSGSGLDRYLKNELLVQQFTSQGGAYLVGVTVTMDPATISGFKWTSRSGAPISFGSGTLLAGKIVVDEMRPLALVIPAIRKWLGG
ncbi:MAG TPA: NHLP bacteriocin system secretion protein [Gemmatimonadaceae bacterium]|nr:NHLP bacteriocin system secretion protein [Gemmatimonadaceae bacterium]